MIKKLQLTKHIALVVTVDFRNFLWGFKWMKTHETFFGLDTMTAAYLPFVAAIVIRIREPNYV